MARAGAVFTEADLDYVRREFVPLERLCRDRGVNVQDVRASIAAGDLPQASYELPDGTAMMPEDYFDLADAAGGIEQLRADFLARYRTAAAAENASPADAEDEWEAYLTGEYGVCLRRVSPDTILRKGSLMRRIETLLESQRPDSDAWRADLRSAVDELDALERPFAPSYDRLRFGAPSSRDRLITAVRTRYAEAFAERVT